MPPEPKDLPIRFVLVGTSHPGNVGAVARAMKNMALRELVLVQPREFPSIEATARASGADDLLAAARVVASLAEALEGCGLVVGTTARDRDSNFRVLDVREGAGRIVAGATRAPVAVLFGNERTGLTNEELEACHALLRIPANPEYASLNLAMAAQLIAYEIFRLREAPPGRAEAAPRPAATPLASPAEMRRLYGHLEEVLEEIDFRDRTQSGAHLMTRIRRFLQRAELDANEANILRGILTAVQGRRRTAAPRPAEAEVYLDHAATTPVDPRVGAAMQACLGRDATFGNPASATHDAGRAAAARVAAARASVARLVGGAPQEIVFTSGATEANNLALLGLMRASADRGRHLVTSRTEHKAVLDPARALEREGFEVTWLTPRADGVIEPQAVRAALRPDTLLVSLMHVNNETGVVCDIAGIGAACREAGVLLHTDAAQSAGRCHVDVHALGVDLLSFTAHKIYGPKGIGALWVGERARPWLKPILFGGGHERGLRPGTLATHQIAGFGVACDLAAAALTGEPGRLLALRERLWEALAGLGGVERNGGADATVAALLNVSIEGVEGESLVAALRGLAVATGSACNSANDEPSYVLRALGRRPALAQSSLRFSLGRSTTTSDIDRAAGIVGDAVRRLRAVAPEGQGWGGGMPGRGLPRGTPAAAAFGLDPLPPLVRRLFDQLPGGGPMPPGREPRVVGMAGSEVAGARVRFELALSGDTVKDARFRAWGCPHTLAAAAWLTGQLRGRRLEALVPGTPAEWQARLGIPADKLGRLLVIEDSLRDCVQNWPQTVVT